MKLNYSPVKLEIKHSVLGQIKGSLQHSVRESVRDRKFVEKHVWRNFGFVMLFVWDFVEDSARFPVWKSVRFPVNSSVNPVNDSACISAWDSVEGILK